VRVLAICGSLQAQSANRALLEKSVQLAPAGVEVTIFTGLGELPYFNPDLAASETPEPVARWRAAIAAHDALLIACPEYGHSLPGVLKNAIDWLIGSGELEQKLIAITASTNIAVRGRLGLRALRDALGAVSADLVGGEPIVRGPAEDQELSDLLAALAQRHQRRLAGGVDSRPRPPVQVAALGPEDAAAYNAFLLAGLAAHPDTLRIAAADIAAAPFATLATADAATFVALGAQDEWAGVVTVEREPGRQKRHHIGWIYRMYVDARYAGAGVGRALLRAALARARAMPGLAKVNLTVAAHNRAAIHLYTSEGFREFAREEDAFRDPQPRRELSMTLSLHPDT
jgi:NAD(P)H-dependent FMN reductase/GNAT superfamily N-acetyltransferase